MIILLLRIKHQGGEIDHCDIGTGDIFGLVSEAINNTPMPKEFKDIYRDTLVFEVDCDVPGNERQYDFGDSVLNVVDSITFDGADSSDVVIEYDDVVLVGDLDAFFNSNDVDSYFGCDADRDVIDQACERILSAEKGGISWDGVNHLKWVVADACKEKGAIKQINCDFENDSVKVVFKSGKELTIPIV